MIRPGDESVTLGVGGSAVGVASRGVGAADASQDAAGPKAFFADLATLDHSRGWPAFLAKVPISYARRHRLVGVLDDADRPVVVMAEPARTWDCFDTLRRWLDRSARAGSAEAEAVASCINRLYEGRGGQADRAIRTIEDGGGVSALLQQAPESEVVTSGGSGGSGGGDLLDGEGRAPVVRLANALLFEAVKLGASDVHVQPTEDRVAVRMRIDGVLFDAYELPRSTHEELVSRIKVMGRMDIAEKRLPQDGRASVRVGRRKIDLRLSTVPTSHGERVVFRLLDKSARLYGLDELGMPPEVLREYSEVIKAEHGLVLVTGPTGSGKSTTLYGSLQRINCTELNVLTLEDPIEYQLPGVSQMQVSEKKGMSFARGLRSVLRQDPDIIMVGEVRDRETAELAIQAALTGHLVFSTLHTNDAASAVTRLLDLGIEPYLVSSSLLAVMAQRLVRRVCPDCGRVLPPEEGAAELRRLRLDDGEPVARANGSDESNGLFRGKGCAACRGTGYRGRVGLYEYLPVDESLREAVQQRAPASRLKRVARSRGMRSLRDDGVRKVRAGLTTVDEVLRVTLRSADSEGGNTIEAEPLQAEAQLPGAGPGPGGGG